jgi:biopolymer transport protein ExbB/TolQ
MDTMVGYIERVDMIIVIVNTIIVLLFLLIFYRIIKQKLIEKFLKQLEEIELQQKELLEAEKKTQQALKTISEYNKK